MDRRSNDSDYAREEWRTVALIKCGEANKSGEFITAKPIFYD